MIAKLLASLGAPLQLKDGEILPPLQPKTLATCSSLMVEPSLTSALFTSCFARARPARPARRRPKPPLMPICASLPPLDWEGEISTAMRGCLGRRAHNEQSVKRRSAWHLARRTLFVVATLRSAVSLAAIGAKRRRIARGMRDGQFEDLLGSAGTPVHVQPPGEWYAGALS